MLPRFQLLGGGIDLSEDSRWMLSLVTYVLTLMHPAQRQQMLLTNRALKTQPCPEDAQTSVSALASSKRCFVALTTRREKPTASLQIQHLRHMHGIRQHHSCTGKPQSKARKNLHTYKACLRLKHRRVRNLMPTLRTERPAPQRSLRCPGLPVVLGRPRDAPLKLYTRVHGKHCGKLESRSLLIHLETNPSLEIVRKLSLCLMQMLKTSPQNNETHESN